MLCCSIKPQTVRSQLIWSEFAFPWASAFKQVAFSLVRRVPDFSDTRWLPKKNTAVREAAERFRHIWLSHDWWMSRDQMTSALTQLAFCDTCRIISLWKTLILPHGLMVSWHQTVVNDRRHQSQWVQWELVQQNIMLPSKHCCLLNTDPVSL